jgi:hypothetical protein
MVLVYALPAVRNAWADLATPWNGTSGQIDDPGNAFVAAGWQASSNPPPYQYFNWALNWVGQAVRYFMQNGIVDWQAGELYQAGAVVVYNSVCYQCKVNNTTGTIPSFGGTAWDRLTDYALISDLLSYVTAAQLATDLSFYAALNSPTLTGVPLAPTAVLGTSNGQIASTAFVQNAIANINLSGYLTVAAAAATYATKAFATGSFTNTANTWVQTWPSGQMMQGGVSGGGGSPFTVSLPQAFPTQCTTAVVSPANTTGGFSLAVFFARTTLTVYGAGGIQFTWMAMGF